LSNSKQNISAKEKQNNLVESPILLKGYEFVDKHSIQPNEIISLRESVGWLGDTQENWQQAIEQPLGVIVGVRSQEGEFGWHGQNYC
jgi:hypothetical protein